MFNILKIGRQIRFEEPMVHNGGSGGGGSTNTVQSADPWVGVQPNIKDIISRAQGLSNQPSTMFPDRTFIGASPLEQMGQAEKLRYGVAGSLPQIGNAQAAQQQMLNAPNLESNPYAMEYSDFLANRMGQDLEQQVGGIRQGAIGAGQKGGSREGVAEGILRSRGAENIAGARAGLLSQMYGQGLDQQARGMAFVPQSMQMGNIPGQAMMEAGAFGRGQEGMLRQEDIMRHEFAQDEPWNRLQQYNAFVQGMPWNQSSVTDGGGSSGGFNPLGAIAGGAAGLGAGGIGTGALGFAASQGGLGGLGSLAMANPWGAGLGVLGALAGGGLFG